MADSVERPKVFISYSGLAPIAQVSKAIEARGFTPFSPYDLPVGSPLMVSLLSELHGARFAIFVIADQQGALNAAVELGIALAAGLPTVILASPDAELPDIASNLPVVRSDLDDEEGLRRALTAIEDLSAQTTTDTAPHRPRTLGDRSELLLDSWADLKARAPDGEGTAREGAARAEALLAQAFADADIRAIQEPSGPFSEADFAVWDASLEPFVASPLLVEVVAGRWPPRRLELKIRQLDEFVGELPPGRWALLVLADDQVDEPVSLELVSGRHVLVISLRELLERMRDETFADVVRTLRNERVHS